MYLISDNVDTLTGLRLAGVDGVVVPEVFPSALHIADARLPCSVHPLTDVWI